MSGSGNRPTEYSIAVTNQCNLRCGYCVNGERRQAGRTLKADTARIINHIRHDAAHNRREHIAITFYGGEPLMEMGVVKEIIAGTKDLNPFYTLFTNGALVSTSIVDLLNSLHVITVAFDGDKLMHDAARGVGTYDRILHNFRTIKAGLKARVNAFVALTPFSRPFESVTGAAKEFDGVFWFLENAPITGNLDNFFRIYGQDLDRLLDFWMENLRQGKVVNLIPFQRLFGILENKLPFAGLPCGSGSSLQVLAMDGSLYTCEDSYHNNVGSLDVGMETWRVEGNGPFEICAACEVKSICSGRCAVPHLKYSKEKVAFYCACTKLLISKFTARLPEIKNLISQGVVAEPKVLNLWARFTDVLP